MHLARLLSVPVCCLLVWGCSRQPAETPGGGSGGGAVSPSSRIGWDQQAADVAELNSLRFVIYIDGNRVELAGASCTATAGSAGYPCTAPLPAMSAGQHTLELASYIVSGSILESARSAPLTITIGPASVVAAVSSAEEGASVPAPRRRSGARELNTTDGARLRLDVITAAESPSALAVSEEGTLVIGYGESRIRVIRNREVVGDESLPSSHTDGSNGRTILDIALDPEFPRSRQLYVLEVIRGESPTFRVSRFREAGGRMGEGAVLLDGVPAGRLSPAASLAFGSDGRLYIGFDNGDDPERAGRLASYNGKILRLNRDGTVPPDQPGASPVYASEFSAPRSLSLDTQSSSLWVADQGTELVRRLGATPGSRGVETAYTLPASEKPASIAMYGSGLIPELRGDLLIAVSGPRDYLLRARLEADGRNLALVERLTIPGGSPVRLVETSPGGVLYVATQDSVVRLAPR